jgi:DNA-binding NarL/FixJ family response regulator
VTGAVVTSLPMCGRAGEQDALAAAWARVVAGDDRPQIVVITGEAGIGKSRLVAEALGALRPEAGCVLAGQARTHAPAPYDWMASALSGRSLPDVSVPADALAWLTQRPDGPTRRYAPDALLRVAVDVTRAILGAGPGVLVVEDLHDLDPASLALVADLAATQSLPALMLITSRAPEAAAFPGLAARVLARVTGTPRSTRLHLPPLSPPEVAAVLEAGFGAPPPPEVVLAAHRRTGGNAFWLTELVTASRGADAAALAGAPLPDHVARLALDRLAGESADIVRLARTAAVLGERVETAQLAFICDTDVEPPVRRLVDLGLFVLDPDGEPRFRYPLVREAIASTALPATRAAVLARASAFTTGDNDLADLTAREREVLGCVASGMSNRQVAKSLGISIRTVTVHVSNVLRKTGSASRTEAALWAIQHGLART